VINSNFGHILHHFEILLHEGRKIAFLPYLPCFEAPARGNRSEFLDETYPAETRGMGLLYGKNCIMLTSNAFDWSTRVTDGQTEGQMDRRNAMAYMRYSIYAVVRNNDNRYNNNDDNNSNNEQ